MDVSITFKKIDVNPDLEKRVKDLRSYDGKLVAVRDASEPNLLFVGKMIVEGNNKHVYYLNTEDERIVKARLFRYDEIIELFVESSK